ncbi:hypothetical protein CLOP_g1947 [Closterium sp. NIES-67]|nr:hypothetical protein CLOP_g1947 [Closterium sp. NIES-67]
MVLTGHWITSDFQLRQVVMEFEQLHGSHTGVLIAETFERVLTEWGLVPHLFGVTTDNAENNAKAMRLLTGEDPGLGRDPILKEDRHFRLLA